VGSDYSEDVKASISALKSFGIAIQKKNAKSSAILLVRPKLVSSSKREIYAGGSGTTARFAIAFAAIPSDGGSSVIIGDSSLLERPMLPLMDALAQIGAKCYSRNSDGKLPVVVEAEGLEGGDCRIDGSISSQFISALLIACTQARNDTTVEIENPSEMVSYPYIEATQFVLKIFGFKITLKKSSDSFSFHIKGNQTGIKGRKFSVPGDMSSAAALIGATIAAKGRIRLDGVNLQMLQADSAFLKIARQFGATISQRGVSLIVSGKGMRNDKRKKMMSFDLKDSPDLVPVVAGVAAAQGREAKIRNVGHLRFKESDRLSSLSKELGRIGLQVTEAQDSLSLSPSRNADAMGRDELVTLSSYNDHRILMALTIAGISGNFGKLLISDPSCVNKSYPAFLSDLKRLAHDKKLLSIVRRG
jgi:3-phosphoshikimate 1-carboxyvinyltransferase